MNYEMPKNALQKRSDEFIFDDYLRGLFSVAAKIHPNSYLTLNQSRASMAPLGNPFQSVPFGSTLRPVQW